MCGRNVGKVYNPVTAFRRDSRVSAIGPVFAFPNSMFTKLKRLFTIKTRFEAGAVIYALAVGAVSRGYAYLDQYPGTFGWLLFAACLGTIFLAGGKLFDSVRPPRVRRASIRAMLARRTRGGRTASNNLPPARKMVPRHAAKSSQPKVPGY